MDFESLEDEKLVIGQTWKRRQNQHYLEGFREGAFDAKEKSIEAGLPIGYTNGFESGYSFGIFNGVVKVLKLYDKLENDHQCSITPFQNIQHEGCYICFKKEFPKTHMEEKSVNDIIYKQKEHLQQILKKNSSYFTVINKYVKARQ